MQFFSNGSTARSINAEVFNLKKETNFIFYIKISKWSFSRLRTYRFLGKSIFCCIFRKENYAKVCPQNLIKKFQKLDEKKKI